MQNDSTGLNKIMDLLRAVSILFILIHIYWYCYEWLYSLHFRLDIIDKILTNFNRTTGLFTNSILTKLFSTLFLALSCLGTRGVKSLKINWEHIITSLIIGILLFYFNWWLLSANYLTNTTKSILYIFTLALGYIFLLLAGTWLSRLLKDNLMDDVFNEENESFKQGTRYMENEYSVNLRTRFMFQKKWHYGWVNVVNPFRATAVLGTPGSGKSYAIINSYIKQHISKGFAMYIYGAPVKVVY